MTRCVVIAVAVLLAAGQAWGHTFPPMRTLVAQVEDQELVVMVGYRPGSASACALRAERRLTSRPIRTPPRAPPVIED